MLITPVLGKLFLFLSFINKLYLTPISSIEWLKIRIVVLFIYFQNITLSSFYSYSYSTTVFYTLDSLNGTPTLKRVGKEWIF